MQKGCIENGQVKCQASAIRVLGGEVLQTRVDELGILGN